MKRNLLLFLILLISLPAFSQNWAPINTSERFCYSSDDDLEIINNVLWVDSTFVDGTIEKYYFNLIAIPYQADGEDIYLQNQAQFLLDEMKILPSGQLIFEDIQYPYPSLQSFSLYPYENVNFQWEFSDGIDALITGKTTMELFGEIDSIKIIELENGKQITLSKNHGIVSWFDEYQLIGIEGRNLGQTVPKFSDMFDKINAGDVACYYSGETFGTYPYHGNICEKRYDILDITRTNDSVSVVAEIRTVCYDWPDESNMTYSHFMDTLKYYPNEYTEVYPNEVLTYDTFEEEDNYVVSRLDHDDWSGINKTQVDYLSEGQWWVTNYKMETGIFGEELQEYYWGIRAMWEYSVDFGFPSRGQSGQYHSEFDALVGVLDDGVEYGDIYPLEMFVGTNKLTTNSNWLVYPNPAIDFITIQTPDNQSNIDYKLYNLNGILLKEGKGNQNESKISIKELPKGMYFIELNINGEKSTKKWIKN